MPTGSVHHNFGNHKKLQYRHLKSLTGDCKRRNNRSKDGNDAKETEDSDISTNQTELWNEGVST